jgi:hypothetical protein
MIESNTKNCWLTANTLALSVSACKTDMARHAGKVGSRARDEAGARVFQFLIGASRSPTDLPSGQDAGPAPLGPFPPRHQLLQLQHLPPYSVQFIDVVASVPR